MKPTKGTRKIFALLGLGIILSGCGSDDPGPDPGVLSDWKVGDVFYDDNRWIQCIVGDMPLVISVPHGGSLRPDSVPDRDCAGITTVRDGNTVELAEAIREEMMAKYGKTPYIIFSHIARTKVDLNRDLPEATCNNESMERTWKDFHDFVDRSLEQSAKAYGKTLYIDLHGHGHTIQRLELGFGLNISELGRIYTGTGLQELGESSSMNNLLSAHSTYDIQELLIGDLAFGTLMAERGIPSVPSKQDPHPMVDEPYFNGGYNTRLYTSGTYPDIFGWQIETHRDARNSAGGRTLFAQAFCESYFDTFESL